MGCRGEAGDSCKHRIAVTHIRTCTSLCTYACVSCALEYSRGKWYKRCEPGFFHFASMSRTPGTPHTAPSQEHVCSDHVCFERYGP